jgi:threonine dehydrogenase-like Zn-dependent dehydrogenase
MKAAVFHEPGRMIVQDIPVPTIADDELLIRVRSASICGTDLRISRHGHFKIPAGQHRVQGHEVAGDVVLVGREVTGYREGDRVSVTPNVGCGHCRFCRLGLNNMCPDYEAFGVSLDGGFEEYLRIPGFAVQRGNVFQLPDRVSYAEAALVEPFSCCLRGQEALDVGYEDTVLIVGAGPIGAFNVMLARLAGAKKIIVANRSQPRLDRMKEFGADVLINVSEQDLTSAVLAETDGQGVDVAITAVCSEQVQATAVQLLATHGRLNFFAGLGVAADVGIDTNRVHYKGLTLTGTTGSSNADYAKALQLVGDGRVDLSGLLTATFSIQDIAGAFEYAASGAGMKAVVSFDGSEQSGAQQ